MRSSCASSVGVSRSSGESPLASTIEKPVGSMPQAISAAFTAFAPPAKLAGLPGRDRDLTGKCLSKVVVASPQHALTSS